MATYVVTTLTVVEADSEEEALEVEARQGGRIAARDAEEVGR